MGKRNTKVGICRLCKNSKELSFEHIPPKVAFNKNTRYYSIPHQDVLTDPNPLEYKPKGMIHQGGLGYYSLCRGCNSFLGTHYVKDFAKWANIGMDINSKYTFNYAEILMEKVNPLFILKQIISMFICMNQPWFTEEYAELLDFVKDPGNRYLPERYKLYTYMNDEGQVRTWGWVQTNIYGALGEFTFPPFGYVLTLNEGYTAPNLTNITSFKNYESRRDLTVRLGLRKHPTYLAIPLDYRSKDDIRAAIKVDEADGD